MTLPTFGSGRSLIDGAGLRSCVRRAEAGACGRGVAPGGADGFANGIRARDEVSVTLSTAQGPAYVVRRRESRKGVRQLSPHAAVHERASREDDFAAAQETHAGQVVL